VLFFFISFTLVESIAKSKRVNGKLCSVLNYTMRSGKEEENVIDGIIAEVVYLLPFNKALELLV
jgi:hypothetical protein